jgi:hypothetical protein
MRNEKAVFTHGDETQAVIQSDGARFGNADRLCSAICA